LLKYASANTGIPAITFFGWKLPRDKWGKENGENKPADVSPRAGQVICSFAFTTSFWFISCEAITSTGYCINEKKAIIPVPLIFKHLAREGVCGLSGRQVSFLMNRKNVDSGLWAANHPLSQVRCWKLSPEGQLVRWLWESSSGCLTMQVKIYPGGIGSRFGSIWISNFSDSGFCHSCLWAFSVKGRN